MTEFEKMINDEVEKRVEERIHRNNVNYRVKFYQEQLEILNNLKGKIQQVFEEHIRNLEEKIEYNQFDQHKCDFHECANFGDGNVDTACKGCSNHQVKNEKVKQHDININQYTDHVMKRRQEKEQQKPIDENTQEFIDVMENTKELTEYEKYIRDILNSLIGGKKVRFKWED